MSKRVKRTLRYGLIRLALAVVGLLPINWASRVGAAFGTLAFALAGRERRKALESLTTAFPDWAIAQREETARKCFRHLGAAAFELACIHQLDAQMPAHVAWPAEDRARLDAALARQRGVVFISGHIGNWELLARRVSLEGYPCQTIAKETSDSRMTALVERFRASAKLKSIWRGQPGAAKHMLRALKAGEILGLLIDQDTNVQSVFVPFFGKPAKTPRAAADLALRTQAAVVLGFCQRQGPAQYQVSMEEVPLPKGDGEAAVEALTATLTARIEAKIREAPEQWVWMHQRWKSQPLLPPPPST
ncbi:MAG: lysophospholipid acyltransferase family protein [Myxococcaceae bacterium]|nr:lysophospholipid acyltransferase family protein [Myxococcaceae bacterium]